MKRFFQLMAVAVIAFGAVGCSGDDDDDDNTVLVAPAVKDDGTTAANFACNAVADPVVGGVGTVALSLTVAAPNVSGGADPVAGVTVQRIDPSDLSTIGAASAASDAGGQTSLDIDGNTRAALNISGPTGFITTKYYTRVTPPAAGADSVLIIPEAIYGAFIGLLGFQPSDLAGTGQISGAVADCDGDTIANAVIQVHNATPAFIGYFGATSGTPDKNAVHTAADGQFLVVGVPPTSAVFHLESFIYDGTDAEGAPTTSVAQAFAQAVGDEIAIAIVSPKFAP